MNVDDSITEPHPKPLPCLLGKCRPDLDKVEFLQGEEKMGIIYVVTQKLD